MVNSIMIRAYTWGTSLIESLKNESGQDLIEYAVLAGGIGVALFIAIAATPLNFDGFINAIQNCISMGGTCP